jgi:hypothetical protein
MLNWVSSLCFLDEKNLASVLYVQRAMAVYARYADVCFEPLLARLYSFVMFVADLYAISFIEQK